MGGLKTRANAHIHALWANSSQEEQAREDVERRSERATKQTPVSLAVAEDLTRDRDDAHARAPGEPERAREGLGALCRPGKLLELSGDGDAALLTTAAAIVREAQRERETTAWVQPTGGPLFPPDLAEAGVDLESLIVVHVPRPAASGRPKSAALELARAAELLLRSGAFGLVVLDLCEAPPPRSSRRGATWQARLLALARQHHSRLVILTQKPDHHDSAGPLVNLRVAPRRVLRASPRGLGFEVIPRVLKDKSGDAPALSPDARRGPWGLT